MTFEEFFKKKKISLVALEQSEPGLFSEFKVHFEKMGEKSFDHTKKYWFNKLRLRFPAPPEPKVEKIAIENPLAEQTITETLGEKPAQSTPKCGFTPKFKAGATKPAETAPAPEAKPEIEKSKETEKPASAPTGFKPRFKAGITKPAEPAANTESAPEPEKPADEKPASAPVGFKPRFKAGVTKPAIPNENTEPAPEPEKTVEEEEPASAPVGFKPRFKAGVTKSANPSPEQKDEPKKEE
ncbi:hypothetical protein [Mucilaginibacter sp. BT774]|uniref:hypothetical protein n=1 Tax=Mucilaginibacter sp. BT774 TaxID=3062276 RepID=UPI002674E92E|nr:hypothetical protein [Mucilaginibacter sp. BT774]MDO3625526.1 hypothetical protein [Mucilaginibacter sp. BT774]